MISSLGRLAGVNAALPEAIYLQQVQLLYAQAPFGIIASALIAPLLVLILWDAIPHPLLIVWVLLLEMVVLLRLGLVMAFRRSAPLQPAPWAGRYLIASALSGALWGSAVLFIRLSPSLVYDVFIALVLGGVLMGGVFTMSPVFNVYLVYALPLVLPSALWLLAQDHLIHSAIGAMGCFYLLLAIGTAQRYYHTLTASLRLSINNSELANSYAAARQQVEQHCQRLAEALQQQERIAAIAQRQQTLLAHASRLNLLGEMASELAHEIKQPMTAIHLYTQVCLNTLRSANPDLHQIEEALQKILAQDERANAIIQKICSFARQGQAQYTKVWMHTLLEEIMDFLHLEAQQHGIDIYCDAAPTLPPIYADGLQIQQVILNLVRNAIDATLENTTERLITISAHAHQKYIEVAVRDSGSGLSPDMARQIPMPFFTTKSHGLGLGIPISQTIINAHGGKLWVSSIPDSGAVFHFTLPIADAEEAYCDSGLKITH